MFTLMCSHRGSKDRCHLPTASWPLQRSSGEDTGQATTCAMALSGRRGQWKGGQWGVSLVYQSGPAACLDLPSVPCVCSPGAADLSESPHWCPCSPCPPAPGVLPSPSNLLCVLWVEKLPDGPVLTPQGRSPTWLFSRCLCSVGVRSGPCVPREGDWEGHSKLSSELS